MRGLNDLYYFVQVVDEGGYAAAARQRASAARLGSSNMRTARRRSSRMSRLVNDDMAALCDAALAGVGVASLPTMMVWRQVEAGLLVHVLPDWRPPAGIVHAVFPSRRGLLPSVRTLLDFLAVECAETRKRAAV